MVRNCTDLVEEGVRRLTRVARKGVRRESLSEYSAIPREDGSPAGAFHISFDMMGEAGFSLSEFIPRFDAKYENGLVSNAMWSGLSFSSSTAGQASRLSTGIGEVGIFPIPGLLTEEK